MKKTNKKKNSETFDQLRKGIRSASIAVDFRDVIVHKYIKVRDNLVYHKTIRFNKDSKVVTVDKNAYKSGGC